MKTLAHAIAAICLLSTAAHAEDAAPRLGRASAVCVAAESARLATAEGVALVSRGGSFSEARDGAELLAGDRLLIRGGAASLFAGGGELARAGSGALLTLDRRDGKLCVAQTSSSPAAIAAGSSGQGADDGHDCSDPTRSCILILGGLAVGGVAGGVAAATSGGSDNSGQTATLIYLSHISPQ